MVVVISVWIGPFERVGFTVTGVIAFFALAMITDREPPKPMRLLRYLVVGLVVVIGFQLLFVKGLNVQLPNGSLFSSR